MKIDEEPKKNYHPQKLKEYLTIGLELTFKKLLKEKKVNNGIFVFSENGKIIRVKAADINE